MSLTNREAGSNAENSQKNADFRACRDSSEKLKLWKSVYKLMRKETVGNQLTAKKWQLTKSERPNLLGQWALMEIQARNFSAESVKLIGADDNWYTCTATSRSLANGNNGEDR